MNKEIKYNGFSANPSDHENIEGDLAVAMNLIPENATIKPVLPPGVEFELPHGYRVMCIHKTSNFTHYILLDDNNGLWWIDKEDERHTLHGNGTATEAPMYTFDAGTEVYKVEPIGNTLTVLTSTGIHYLLWKNGTYLYLGNHLPELDLKFSLVNETTVSSETHTVTFDGPTTVQGIQQEAWPYLRQAVMASLNQAVARANEEHKFSNPFFVRYAYRLYDGNITMHSAPILMVPTFSAPSVSMGWEIIDGRTKRVKSPANVQASVKTYNLRCEALDEAQCEQLENWSDIVISVDVFISPMFYTYNQATKDEDISITLNGATGFANEQMNSLIVENGNFYLLKQLSLSGIETAQHGGGRQSRPSGNNRGRTGGDRRLSTSGGEIKLDFAPNNDNIVVRERMTDDYGSHDMLIARMSQGYNARINLCRLSKRLFNGFNPACMFHCVGDSNEQTTKHTVVVETNGQEIVMESKQATVIYDNNGEVLWYFYPNINAKRVYVEIGQETKLLKLAQHSQLNGAFFFARADDAEVSQENIYTPDVSEGEDAIVEMPNKLYTSEVNNPFFFPVTGINTVGTGEILAVCAAVKALSQGQFGQFPLYAFTSEGIWALQTNSEGGYSAIQPVTRDVCRNPDSITQLDDAVLFTTDRGIMLISGSTTQCISTNIDDKGVTTTGIEDVTNLLARILDLGDVAVHPFRDFLPECRMIYDYENQRVVVYNPAMRRVDGDMVAAFPYAYIYSLESHKWGMMQSTIDYSINAYPDAMAVNKAGELINFSECEVGDQGFVNALLVTRPLTLDMPDAFKTVDTVLQRGMFRPASLVRMTMPEGAPVPVQSVLYGSRDLYNWHLVASSQDENLRGFRGTPYKYYRIALLLRLQPDESVTGASLQLTPRYNNRLR